MAAYPGAIYSVPSFGTNMSDVQTHTTWRDAMIDEMRAVQIELGTTPSGTFSTVRDRLALIRRRDSRSAIAYSNTDNILAPGLGSNIENAGGITIVSNAYVIPAGGGGTYALTLKLNPDSAWGSGNTATLNIVSGGNTYLADRRTLQDTSVGVTVSWTIYLAAAATVQFVYGENTYAGNVAFECEVAKTTIEL